VYLRISGRPNLSFGTQCINSASKSLQVFANDPAGGMVSTHRGGSISDGHALDCPGIVSRYALPFDGRHPVMAEMFTYRIGPIADNFSEFSTFGDIFHHFNGRGSIAKRFIARIHCHGDGHTGVHSVKADVITEKIKLCD